MMVYNTLHKHVSRKGFALFLALVTSSIVLAIGMSILSITLKEMVLSSAARDSEMAFNAADAGLECVLYWNASTKASSPYVDGAFSGPGNAITCMGSASTNSTFTPTLSGGHYTAQVNWGSAPALCTKIDVVRVVAPAAGCGSGVCLTVVSRGYNRACNNLTDPHTVERAFEGDFFFLYVP